MSTTTTGTWDWPACFANDTFDAISVTGITINGANPTNSLTSVRIHLRTTPAATGAASLELTSTAGDIAITDADTWAIRVESFVPTLAAGRYYYDVEFTDSAGNVRTYLWGTWTIKQDTTR